LTPLDKLLPTNSLHTIKAKRYLAHGCKEKDCKLIENSAGRNEIFSKLPASALPDR